MSRFFALTLAAVALASSAQAHQMRPVPTQPNAVFPVPVMGTAHPKGMGSLQTLLPTIPVVRGNPGGPDRLISCDFCTGHAGGVGQQPN